LEENMKKIFSTLGFLILIADFNPAKAASLDPKSRDLVNDVSIYLEAMEKADGGGKYGESALNIKYDDVFKCRDEHYNNPPEFEACIQERTYDLRKNFSQETKLCHSTLAISPQGFGVPIVLENNVSENHVPFSDSTAVCVFQVNERRADAHENAALRKCSSLIGLFEGEVPLNRMPRFKQCVDDELSDR
jgi:hypothetical protein